MTSVIGGSGNMTGVGTSWTGVSESSISACGSTAGLHKLNEYVMLSSK